MLIIGLLGHDDCVKYMKGIVLIIGLLGPDDKQSGVYRKCITHW